ncbi:MAG: TRAP transporter substrate-binding protein DctP [Elusimicrobia bacterium]|nr:TRAP transporter substrate-binding protein DctP [Elusimicrobiota bacterium]
MVPKNRPAVAPSGKKAARQPRFRMRWVLAHEPISLFEPAAREFARLVEAGTRGEVRVDILSLADYSPGRSMAAADVAEEAASGRLEMAQTYAHAFGRLHAPILAVDAPFLFRSHEHATRVLDGEIGRGLLAPLRTRGLRGLAFTYSGGYRIVSSTGLEIRRLEDLRGLRVRTSPNPVAVAALEALAARPVPAPLERVNALTREGLIDAAETTYPRYWLARQHEVQGVVNETGHSLLTTVVAMNEAFFQSLPRAHQDVVVAAAGVIARGEREYSISEGEKARAAALAAGVKIVALDPRERRRVEAAALEAYERIGPLVGADLIDAIRAAA